MNNLGHQARVVSTKSPEKDKLDKLINENMIVTSQGHQRWHKVKGKYIAYNVTQETWDNIFK